MQVKLGPNTFEIPSPRGMESFALVQRIMPPAGRVISMMLSLLGEDPTTADPATLLDADLLKLLPLALPGLGRIFSEMAPGEFEGLTRALLRETTCDGLPLFAGGPGGDAFDALMRGRTLDTFKLLGHAVLAWYPDVFTLARDLKVPGLAGSPSSASTTSPAAAPVTASSAPAGAASPSSPG